MEFDELLVTTGVDALVRLVKQKKKIDLEECSRILNLSVTSIEEWAHVLEDEGIIRIEYRLARVYLVWVSPTQAEIEVEQKSFNDERDSIRREVEDAQAKVGPEIKKMSELEEEFSQFYKKIYPKIEAMEKAVSQPLRARKGSGVEIEKQLQKLDSFDKELDSLKHSLEDIRQQVGGVRGNVSGTRSEESIKKMEKLLKEMKDIEAEARALEKKAGKEQKLPDNVKIPNVQEIKEKFEKISRDFADIRHRSSRVREDMTNLAESKGIVSEVGDSLKDYEKRIQKLENDLGSAITDAKELEARSRTLSESVAENTDLVQRFKDSLDVAKGILTRFPSHAALSKELKAIKDQEASIDEQYQYLKKIIDALGGKQTDVREFEDLSARIAEKIEILRSESDYLTTVLEEEKGTYLTYQNIKERIVPSLNAYEEKLKKLGEELQNSKKEISAQQKQAKDELKKIKGKLKEGDLDKVAELAEEIDEKKRIFDEIFASMQVLREMSDSLNKRLTLLSREARLLELRAEGSHGSGEPGGVATTEEIKEKLDLTREEEEEFRRKREELKNLIKKLWEDA